MERYAEKDGAMKGRVDVEDFREMERETGKTPTVLKEMPALPDEHKVMFSVWDFLRGITSHKRISISEMRDYLAIHSEFNEKEFIEVINAIDVRAGY